MAISFALGVRMGLGYLSEVVWRGTRVPVLDLVWVPLGPQNPVLVLQIVSFRSVQLLPLTGNSVPKGHQTLHSPTRLRKILVERPLSYFEYVSAKAPFRRGVTSHVCFLRKRSGRNSSHPLSTSLIRMRGSRIDLVFGYCERGQIVDSMWSFVAEQTSTARTDQESAPQRRSLRSPSLLSQAGGDMV